MLLKLLTCLIAGAGAGFGTGLAGLSAAAVISPMLITFLHINFSVPTETELKVTHHETMLLHGKTIVLVLLF